MTLTAEQAGRRALTRVARQHKVTPPAEFAEAAVAAVLAAKESVKGRPITVSEDIRLTGRQVEILRLIACGLSNLEIGQRLFIAEDTVKTILRLMFKQLGARNRAHAVAIGFRHGVIRPQDITGGER